MWTYFLVAIFGRRERESRASPGAQFGLSLAAFLRYVSFNWINAISLAMCAHFVSTENDVMGEEKVGPSAMNTWYRIVDRAYAVAIFTCFLFFSESYDLIWILLNDLREPCRSLIPIWGCAKCNHVSVDSWRSLAASKHRRTAHTLFHNFSAGRNILWSPWSGSIL